MSSPVDVEAGANSPTTAFPSGAVRHFFESANRKLKSDETSFNEKRRHNDPPTVLERAGVTETFNKLAAETMDQTVLNLDSHLNIILTFSALFSGAISGLLSLSWPLLSASSSDQTNYLLALLVSEGNSSFPPPSPPEAFVPSSSAVAINVLISLSLTCSLLASFGAVLGKQWLLSYGRITAQTPAEIQHQRQSWLDGANFWRLQGIIEGVLPLLLQAALIMFIIGLIEFFSLGSTLVAKVNYAVAIVGMSFIVLSGVLALYDPYCPYQTPVSESIVPRIFKIIWGSIWIVMTLLLTLIVFLLVPILSLFYIIWTLTLEKKKHATKKSLRKTFALLGSSIAYLVVFAKQGIFGWGFDTWMELVGGVMSGMRKGDVSTSVTSGSTAAWLLETSQDQDKLKNVVSCFDDIQDENFIHAFLARDTARHISRRWVDATHQLRSIPSEDPLTTHAQALRESVPLFETALLHTFISVQYPSIHHWKYAAQILERRIAFDSNDEPQWGNEFHVLPLELQCAYVAATIKLLVRVRSSFGFFSNYLGLGNRISEGLCIQHIASDTTERQLALIACAAAILPKRPQDAVRSPRKGRSKEMKDYTKLLKVFTNESSLLSAVNHALRTYCGFREDHAEKKDRLPSDLWYGSLLHRTAELLPTSPTTELDVLQTLQTMDRLMLLIHETDGNRRAAPRTVESARDIAAEIESQNDELYWGAVGLVEAILVQLRLRSVGPFSHTATAADLQSWRSEDILHLLTICKLVRKGQFNAKESPSETDAIYRALADWIQGQNAPGAGAGEAGGYLAILKA